MTMTQEITMTAKTTTADVLRRRFPPVAGDDEIAIRAEAAYRQMAAEHGMDPSELASRARRSLGLAYPERDAGHIGRELIGEPMTVSQVLAMADRLDG